MDIAAYLARIGYSGMPSPDLQTLVAIHRAQALSIPYEGFDIQLGRRLDLDPRRIFDKLVSRRRGGWCYETNGLLGWALGALGFRVRRATAGVNRREKGDAALGNHLTLLVDLDGTWLCDLGLGDALRAPIPLVEGMHEDGKLTFRLERLQDGYWRFHNHARGNPQSFDFTEAPADEALLLSQNHRLQTDPASPFVLNAEAILMGPAASVTLLGRVLTFSSPEGVRKEILGSPDALAAALEIQFGLSEIAVGTLWPRIVARHEILFGR